MSARKRVVQAEMEPEPMRLVFHGFTAPEKTEAEILEAIDAERLRLDMSVSMPVRIGYRKGRVFAALSRHPDSKHTEGVHMGDTLREALVSLHRALAATEPTS